MFQRTVLSALAVAAGVAAGIAIRVLTDKKYQEEENDDDEIHFIKLTNEEPEEEEKAEDYPEAVREICAVYPYLKPSFVQETMAGNASLNEQYEEDTLLHIVHSSEFHDPDAIASYVDIMETAGYECSADGNVIRASRKFFTENGAVISDVLNVANQTAALKGTYIGYELNKA